MMQFPGRFLILTCLAVAAALVLQSSSALASDEPVLITTYGCHWDVKVGIEVVGSGDVHNKAFRMAKPAAFLAASTWAEENCPTSPYTISVGEPYPEKEVLPPTVEPEAAMPQRVTSSGQWTVLYRCVARNGKTLETQSSAATFCEAYNESRSFVCEYISNPPFDGACRCYYQVLKRPCCGCCSCCR